MIAFHLLSFLFCGILSLVPLLIQTKYAVSTSDTPTTAESLIFSNKYFSLLETLVDSRFKHLAADFQDEIDGLKIKVSKLEAKKSDDIEINKSYHHALQKRQATSSKNPTPVCLNSTSICTSYFPDHPDAYNNKTKLIKFGSLVKNISSSLKSMCTLYFPDHPDAYMKKDSTALEAQNTELEQNTLNKTMRGKQSPDEAHSKINSFSAVVTNEAIKEMPTNCKDLQLLGHKLNGFYSVKTKEPNQTAKIATIYCDFQSPSDLNGFETRIGVVNIKSSPVHFSVEVKEDFYGNKGEKIRFKKQVLNIGNGFDWENQWFRAPYPGTYFFSVSGSKDSRSGKQYSKADIGIILNEQEIGEALSSEHTLFGGFSCQLSLKLNVSDKVELTMYNGKITLLYFTGWMMEEDLPF